MSGMFRGVRRWFRKTDPSRTAAKHVNPNRAILRDGSTLRQAVQAVLGSDVSEAVRVGVGSNESASYRVTVPEGVVKCYECESPERTQCIVLSTELLLKAGVPFPRVLGHRGAVIVAEWVVGVNPDADKPESRADMARYQRQIHSVQAPSSSCHERPLHIMWLAARLRESAKRVMGCDRAAQATQRLLETVPQGLQTRVLHPDFTRRNLIRRHDGHLVMVDNEFVAVGQGYEYDLYNTLMLLDSGGIDTSTASHYLGHYGEDEIGTLRREEAYWHCCYLAKSAGKAFGRGHREKGIAILEALEEEIDTYAKQRGD